MKKVLVTGADGYCGWPVVLKLLNNYPDIRVYGVDSGGRRDWVEEIGAESILPISGMYRRFKVAKDFFFNRYEFVNADITDVSVLRKILGYAKPDVILHLAAQPSAPYSAIDAEHCKYTQNNNINMLTNLMFLMNEMGMDDTHLVVTTTTGVYGAPPFPIPEGNIRISSDMTLPYPAMGGSWYHMSRAFDAGNLWLASKQFKFPITELRTSIVCGSSTTETKLHPEFVNRFDVDFYFGVVVNRFIAMALTGYPLTVYGKGLQKKPMISLEDMVRTTVNACFYRNDFDVPKYNIMNQLQEPVSIVDLANFVSKETGCEVNHVENPRVEDEEHDMKMDNHLFFEQLAGYGYHKTMEKSIVESIREVKPYRNMIDKKMFMR